MTIMDALRWATEELKCRHEQDGYDLEGDRPMLDAQVLLAYALGVQTSWLFVHFDDPIREEDKKKFDTLIQRRLSYEPVAYLTGKKEFYKRSFEVNPFVLIPRPATETIVEAALEEARGTNPETRLFADIGTGSGAIAVTLAAECGGPVIAIDQNQQALVVVKKNAKIHHVEDCLDIRKGNLLDPLIQLFEKLNRTHQPIPEQLFICANLPYLTRKQWEEAQLDVRLFEPKTALEAGPDGLDAYFAFFHSLSQHRTIFPDVTTILIEIDPSQTKRASALITHLFPDADIEVKRDLEGHERIILVRLSSS